MISVKEIIKVTKGSKRGKFNVRCDSFEQAVKLAAELKIEGFNATTKTIIINSRTEYYTVIAW
jgi:hypothetical protein